MMSTTSPKTYAQTLCTSTVHLVNQSTSPDHGPGPAEVEPVVTGLRLDSAALRMLAHPLRSRLLSRLRIDGPATATTLAGAFDTNTGATSYHLRKLESVGLVDDSGLGTGRQRLWQASTTYHSYDPSDFADDPDSLAALHWLQRDYLSYFSTNADAWLQAGPTWPLEWQDAAGIADGLVVVTAAQLAALRAQMWELLLHYRDAGRGDPAARRVAVYTVAYPLDMDQVPPS